MLLLQLAKGFLDAVPTRLEALYSQTFWNVAVADSALYILRRAKCCMLSYTKQWHAL